MATTLTPKQLTALSTLTSDAALEGRLTFDDVTSATHAALMNNHALQIYTIAAGPVVTLGMREVAALLRLALEWRQNEAQINCDAANAELIAALDAKAAAERKVEVNHAMARYAIEERDAARAELAEWRSGKRTVECPDMPDDLALPLETLDGRAVPVDPIERDPVEVRVFGVGPISAEAEAMRTTTPSDDDEAMAEYDHRCAKHFKSWEGPV